MTRSGPRISVIVFSYNFERYLEECLESILAQTFPPSEIIVTDDCSGDASPKIIEKVNRKNPGRIRAFLHGKNRGMQAHGVWAERQARGDYISTVDGDDSWHPRKLEREWQALERNPVAQIAYSHVHLIDSEGRLEGIWEGGVEGDVFEAVFSRMFFRNTGSIFRNQLTSISAMEAVGYSDPRIPIHIDWDLKLRLTKRFRVARNPEPSVNYRLHTGGISKSGPGELFHSLRMVYEKNRPLLADLPEAKRIRIENEVSRVLSKMEARMRMAERGEIHGKAV